MVDESENPKAGGLQLTIPQTASIVLAGIYVAGFLVINATWASVVFSISSLRVRAM